MKKKILLVEDDDMIRGIAKNKLIRKGYDVIEATNGQEAFDSLKEKPDLIWLDLYMPKVDGMQFLEMIKEGDEYKDLIVFVVTVSVGKTYLVKALQHRNVKASFIKTMVPIDTIIDNIKKFIG